MLDVRLFSNRLVRNKTIAKFDLLCKLLSEFGDSYPDVRAAAAARLSDLLTVMDRSWEAVAYLIAKHGDHCAVAGAGVLIPSARPGTVFALSLE
jgi:hypothetical protein